MYRQYSILTCIDDLILYIFIIKLQVLDNKKAI